MHKKLLLSLSFSAVILFAAAQYCGNSGSFQCTASNLSLPWLSPPPDSLAPFVNGQPSTTVIQFKNFNTVFFAGGNYTVTSLRIDTIDNLPEGLCWATNKANNTYANQESGCIKINGTPCDSTGQYKMRIIVTVDLGFATAQVNADDANLKYYIRLKNSADADTEIDSFQTAANPFIPYGGVCSALPLNAYLGTNQTVCNGSIVNFNPTVVGGQAPYTYSWQSTGSSLSCSNCPNPSATVTQNSSYIVSVTDANNTSTTDTIQYTVTGAAGNFQISATGPVTYCEGNRVTLKGNRNNGHTYQWLANNANVPQATDTALLVAASGSYALVFNSPNGCYATSNIISVNALPRPDVNIAQTPASACVGDTVTLTALTDTSVHVFEWKLNGNTTANVTAAYLTTTSGNFTAIVRNTAGCYDTTSRTLIFNILPSVSLGGNVDSACSNAGTITLSGGSPLGGVYSGTGITGSTLNPAIGGIGPRLIFYTYTDSNACAKSATEVISIVVCTDINETENENSFPLYPNPATNQLIVEFSEYALNSSVLVYDVAGKQVSLPVNIQGNKILINTTVLAPGIYTLQLNNGQQFLSRKFIKSE